MAAARFVREDMIPPMWSWIPPLSSVDCEGLEIVVRDPGDVAVGIGMRVLSPPGVVSQPKVE